MHPDEGHAHGKVTVVKVIVRKLLRPVTGIKSNQPAPGQRVAGVVKSLFPRFVAQPVGRNPPCLGIQVLGKGMLELPGHVEGLTGLEHGFAAPVGVAPLSILVLLGQHALGPAIDQPGENLGFELSILGEREDRNDSGKGPGNREPVALGNDHFSAPRPVLYPHRLKVVSGLAVVMRNPTLEGRGPVAGLDFPGRIDPSSGLVVLPFEAGIAGNGGGIPGKSRGLGGVLAQSADRQDRSAEPGKSILCRQGSSRSMNSKSLAMILERPIRFDDARDPKVKALRLDPHARHAPTEGNVRLLGSGKVKTHDDVPIAPP